MKDYLNPSNDEYKALCEKPYYVDKTDLIAEFENRESAYMPLGYGKTSILDMVTAFYSKGCDSRELFADKKIANTPNWDKNLNQYNLLRINISEVLDSLDVESLTEISLIEKIADIIMTDVFCTFPSYREDYSLYAVSMLFEKINRERDEQFIIIIDDYDAVYLKEEYLICQNTYNSFMNLFFQKAHFFIFKYFIFGVTEKRFYHTSFTWSCYCSYFKGPTHLKSLLGFNESEVRDLCEKFNMDFNEIDEYFSISLSDNNYSDQEESYKNISINSESEDNNPIVNTYKVYKPESIISLIRDYNCDLNQYKNKNYVDNSLKKLLSFNNNVYEKNSQEQVELLSKSNFEEIRVRGVYEILLLFLKSKIITFPSHQYFYMDRSSQYVNEFFELLSYLGFVQEIENNSDKENYVTSDFVISNKEMEETLNATLKEIPEFNILNEIYKASRAIFNSIINIDDERIFQFLKSTNYSFKNAATNEDTFIAFMKIMFNYCLGDYNTEYKYTNYIMPMGVFFTKNNNSLSDFVRPPMIFYMKYTESNCSKKEIFDEVYDMFNSNLENLKDRSKCIIIAINEYGAEDGTDFKLFIENAAKK